MSRSLSFCHSYTRKWGSRWNCVMSRKILHTLWTSDVPARNHQVWSLEHSALTIDQCWNAVNTKRTHRGSYQSPNVGTSPVSRLVSVSSGLLWELLQWSEVSDCTPPLRTSTNHQVSQLPTVCSCFVPSWEHQQPFLTWFCEFAGGEHYLIRPTAAEVCAYNPPHPPNQCFPIRRGLESALSCQGPDVQSESDETSWQD